MTHEKGVSIFLLNLRQETFILVITGSRENEKLYCFYYFHQIVFITDIFFLGNLMTLFVII